MKNLTEEDLKISEESNKLKARSDKLHKELEEFEAAGFHSRSEFSAIKSKYDEYVKATNEWMEFRDKNLKSLVAHQK